MKKINKALKTALLLIVCALLMSVFASAATPKEMKENGEVSDGSVRFGDERDGIVSDVSSEMGNLGSEVSEFVETVLPGADSTDGINTTETTKGVTTRDSMNATTSHSTTDMANDTANADGSNAMWGITIAIIVVIAVIAIIFFLVKRK